MGNEHGLNPMKTHLIKTSCLTVCFILGLLLTGCNRPSSDSAPTMNVTQAYQTVEAMLTDSVGLTATPTTKSATAVPATESPGSGTTSEAAQPTEAPGSVETMAPAPACNQAAAAFPKIDITIDDDTEMPPGDTFTKIWRLVNIGSCTWGDDYAAVYFSGEKLSASSRVPLENIVAPNESIDIAVDMTAPTEPGEYQSNWKISTDDGILFGIGPGGESPFWVRIIVVELETPTPTATPLPTATPIVAASGAGVMVHEDTIDLDSLLLNTGTSDMTFTYTAGDEPLYELVPQGTASIAVFGTEQPAISDCQNAALDSVPVNTVDLAGTYLCYETDLGLPGWVLIDALDTDTHSVSLQFLTWSLP